MANVSSVLCDCHGRVLGITTEKPFPIPAFPIQGFEITEKEITDGTAFSDQYSADVGDSTKAAAVRLAAVVTGFGNGLISSPAPMGIVEHPEIGNVDATYKTSKCKT